MDSKLKEDSNKIVKYTIEKIKPNKTVKEAIKKCHFNNGKVIVIAIGKAACQMIKAIDISYDLGIVITKYRYISERINNVEYYEAGHPLVDENSLRATDRVIKIVNNLKENDNVLFLLSGGGSALLEKPLISLEELKDINDQLIKCGANIEEINTIRKRLSAIKGGKLGSAIVPAKVFNIILSDVVTDKLDMVASGPTIADTSSSKEALDIVHRYKLNIKEETLKLLEKETIKELNNVETYICGDVRIFAKSAKEICEELGYKTIVISTTENGDIKDTKNKFIKLLKDNKNSKENKAFIIAGEITVKVKGNGLGGRNSQLALEMAKELKGSKSAILCLSSDGSDGPTDAAGGYVDYQTMDDLKNKDLNIDEYITNNDAYHCLKEVDGLVITGPTGSNVNDLYILLIRDELIAL